ncbi:hypothetical protein [Lactiplantibacillus daowaiensis]|uniref:Uncharacterized protein n=1 Tax=Lactiplantibacillus daowaiensis TaxID=2559918 RepID=A0ABW1RY39_9LACO|nr:hypothetical protein [Lactiplantibacillus daowaiensis]
MIALKLDSTGDIEFDANTGTFSMVADDDEVAQALELLLGINLGELDWNPDLGLNHMDVLINGDDKDVVEAIINDYLSDQLGEAFDSFEITDFKIDKLNRLTSLVGTVAIDGDTYKTDVALSQAEMEGSDEEDASD